jgi:hypothetical protein
MRPLKSVDDLELSFAYYSLMGEKRASTARQKLPLRRVYMSFMLSGGWYCQFLESDLKTPLPRKLNFATEDKVTELVRRCGGLGNLEAKKALERALAMGRGGLYLNLTAEQHDKLKKAR